VIILVVASTNRFAIIAIAIAADPS